MNIQNLLYEILYRGFVYEKANHKKRGSELRRFTEHMKLWTIISLGLSAQIMNDNCFNSIVTLIKSDKDLNKIYFPQLEPKMEGIDYDFPVLSDEKQKVQNLIIKLLMILNIQFSGKYSDNLHVLVRALHNLPRCFLLSAKSEMSAMYASSSLCIEYSKSDLIHFGGFNLYEHEN